MQPREVYCINGGNKSEQQAIKHKSTLMRVLRYDDTIPINLDNLRSMSSLPDWVNCLIKEKKESGTIKTYLIKHYLNFCMLKHLYKGIQKRKHVKKLEDLKNFPTTIEIKSMDTSEAAKHVKRCLGNIVPGAEPRMQTFITIRDYVMSVLIFNNCSRPGGIYNMNLGELRDEKKMG